MSRALKASVAQPHIWLLLPALLLLYEFRLNIVHKYGLLREP
jgi:hypothetical protein